MIIQDLVPLFLSSTGVFLNLLGAATLGAIRVLYYGLNLFLILSTVDTPQSDNFIVGLGFTVRIPACGFARLRPLYLCATYPFGIERHVLFEAVVPGGEPARLAREATLVYD